jgi:hypothetical protein
MRVRTPKREHASRLLRFESAAIDAAVLAAGLGLWRFASSQMQILQRDPRTSRASRTNQFVTVLLRQAGSPGQHVLGLRRVDERTDKPVQLWRLLLLTGVEIVTGTVIRLLMRFPPTPEMKVARDRLEREMDAIRVQHAGNREALNAATGRLLIERRAQTMFPLAEVQRWMPAAVMIGLLNRALRRKFAPTTVVVWRR